MFTTRREFLAEGALAFASLFGGRIFAAPKGWKHDGAPNLIFGVLSDTHLRTRVQGNKLGSNWTNRYLLSAFEYFKSRKVDAVAHCGDWAHRGQTREMEFHAIAWRKVFPKDQEPVKLFVTGNHDLDGAKYGDFVAKRYPDPEVRAKHVLSTDMAANWERIWGEKYERVWHKEVKGYHFFGQNYGTPSDEVIASVSKCGKEFSLKDGVKPFFFFSHRRPDVHIRKKALLPLNNAVSFFGHNHWSMASWNILSLYYGRLPVIQCASCEPRGCSALVGDSYITKAKIEGREGAGRGRQGYVVLVYDDMMVIERHEFSNGHSILGSNWIMPLGWKTAKNGAPKKFHPFSRPELTKSIGTPEFQNGAKLEVVEEMVDDKSAKSNIVLKIPPANGNSASQVYAYEIVASSSDGSKKIVKAVYAPMCNLGLSNEAHKKEFTFSIPKNELPSDKQFVFTVYPLSSLGSRGKPIVAKSIS